MKVEIKHNLSPIKYCVFIKPNNKSQFYNAIKCLFSSWCGVYAPILPFYERMPKKIKMRYEIDIDREDFYINTLANYDPDIIIYDDSLDKEKIGQITDDRELVSLSVFNQQLSFGRPDYGFSIDSIINDIVNKDFKYTRLDNRKIQFPKINKRDLFLNTWQGVLLENVEDKYINKFLSKNEFIERPELNHKIIDKYISNEHITILDCNKSKSRLYYKNNWDIKVVIYFLDENEILDIQDFWNLRALGWIIFPIPNKRKDNDSYKSIIIDLITNIIKQNNGIALLNILISDNVDNKPLMKYLDKIIKDEKLKIQLVWENIFPRFWSDSDDILSFDKVLCPKILHKSTQEEVEIDENDYVKIDLPKPPFKSSQPALICIKNYMRFGYNFINDQGKYAEVINEVTTKDWLKIIKSWSHRDEWRVSKNGIIRYIRFDKDRAFFYLPKSFDYFKKYFANKGVLIKETASGKLGKEVLKNIGGLYGINIFSTPNSIKLLQLFEGGKIVHIETLISNIKKLNPFPEFNNKHKDLIELLLDKEIIEFGVHIQCQICEQRSFYLINELNDLMKCTICRNDFKLTKCDPINSIKYVYRGVGPFSRNNKVDGLLSVFLTIRLFKFNLIEGFDRNMSYIFDFEAKKDNNLFEIDLAIIADGKRNKSDIRTFICECKTFKNIEEKDINRLKYFGKLIPNSVLVIATLNKNFSKEEILLLTDLANYFRNKNFSTNNPLLLLSGDELIPNDRHFPLKEYEDDIAGHQHVNYINTLADLTCKKHLHLKTNEEIYIEAWEKINKAKVKKGGIK